MQIYSLAYEAIAGKRPETALQFVESGLVSAHNFTDKELLKTKEDIKKVAEGLKKEEYKATPEYNQCHWCAYKDICPYKTKGA
jgi:DNA helicase-2/ATP-dependent DNA helicase PcrA